jgi:hypothetical protein
VNGVSSIIGHNSKGDWDIDAVRGCGNTDLSTCSKVGAATDSYLEQTEFQDSALELAENAWRRFADQKNERAANSLHSFISVSRSASSDFDRIRLTSCFATAEHHTSSSIWRSPEARVRVAASHNSPQSSMMIWLVNKRKRTRRERICEKRQIRR